MLFLTALGFLLYYLKIRTSQINFIFTIRHFNFATHQFLSFFLISQFSPKHNTSMGLGSLFISFHNQLLKNKWYYVLHSTKLYLSFVSESDENREKTKSKTGFP